MKNLNYFLLFVLLLTFNLIQSQEEAKESKFSIIGYAGTGYGKVINNNEPNYNLISNSGEILLNYNLNQKFGIATGIGINDLSGSGFNSIGNFYHERRLLKIPLLFMLNLNISDRFKIYANLGIFGQTIVRDEFRFINSTQKDIYAGWNFGRQVGFGFLYKIVDWFYVGTNIKAQSDFSNFETNNNVGINDEQKIINLNSFGLIFLIAL